MKKKILFYADWMPAIPYLLPLYNYLKAAEPDWILKWKSTANKVNDWLVKEGLPTGSINYDVAFTCDERSVCYGTKQGQKICIFHGLASKAMAFSEARRDIFVDYPGILAVPSEYYRQKLLDLGVDDSKILVAGLTKFDQVKELPKLREKPKVLFAPTHNRTLSAIPVVKERIYEIPGVRVKLHSITATSNAHPQHLEFRSFYPDNIVQDDITQLILDSDIVIGDLGSVVLEAMALGRYAIQVRNPEHVDYYQEKLGGTVPWSLPELELAPAVGPAYDMEGVRWRLDFYKHVWKPNWVNDNTEIVANIGRASEVIHDFIK